MGRTTAPLLLLAVTSLPSCRGPAGEAAVAEAAPIQPSSLRWELQATPRPDASLRGLSVVDRDVAWASGSRGTVLRTVDGGAQWRAVGPADTGLLDFRDIEALDADTAVISSAGTPARLYRTRDGGGSWTIVHSDARPAAFFDAMAFADREHGLLFADPIDGRMQLFATDDGGATWRALDAATLPSPLAGEAAFAASGSCIAALPGGRYWIATGGAGSRCLHSADGGRTWAVAALPVGRAASSAGAFALAMRSDGRGVAVGGDYQDQRRRDDTAAVTSDGGRSWQPVAPAPAGYRCGVAWWQGELWIAVGDGGSSLSTDDGRSFGEWAGPGFHTVMRAADGTVFAAGGGGRIARLVVAGGSALPRR